MAGRVGPELRLPGISVVWLEKYAIYGQASDGTTRSLDYMLLAEVLPSSPHDQYTVQGFRGDEAQPFVTFSGGDRMSLVNEWLLHRKARSHESAAELDRWFPNTHYRFDVADAKGRHQVVLALGGEERATHYPNVPKITLQQGGAPTAVADSDQDVEVCWNPFETETSVKGDSPLYNENTIFFLLDNCRGETVYSSGSGNKRDRLSPTETRFRIPAKALEPGMRYTVFLSFINYRSSDTVRCAKGVIAGVAVNSICVELGFKTAGSAWDSRECPPIEQRANYRWPGKLNTTGDLAPWPVDASGLMLEPLRPILSGSVIE